jgi:hypothetical protein
MNFSINLILKNLINTRLSRICLSWHHYVLRNGTNEVNQLKKELAEGANLTDMVVPWNSVE